MHSIKDIENLLINLEVKKKIIFPEGKNKKIIETANYIVENNIGEVYIVLENKNEKAENLNKNCNIIFIDEYDTDTLANDLFELRKSKMTMDEAKSLVLKPNYFSTMLLQNGIVDCLLCGIEYTTADTLKPALQIIKTKEGIKTAASVLIMQRDDDAMLFSDCSLNLNPTSEQLSEIAKLCGEFALKMDIKDPELALLSYSTKGSGSGESVTKVVEAKKILDTQKLGFKYDGEMQFDAAFVKEVRDKKMKDSVLVKDKPDIYIFPDLNSGNIGYKIAQRLGGYDALGPFILGLKKPMNDLSRGATIEDVKLSAILTLFQAI